MISTLLEAIQEILSSLDSDEVNNYNDTTESLQIAHILKSTYYDLASELKLPEHDTLFELTASGDVAKPTLMTMPSNVIRLDWIKYDNKATADTYKDYREVKYLNFPDFMDRQYGLNGLSSGVGQMSYTNNSETFEVMYMDDRHPMYYTTMDQYTILFDAYNSDEDTTLQKSKTMAYGAVYPTFTLSNSFTADLDPQLFRLWINTAKNRAWVDLKQAQNADIARMQRDQKIISQKRKRRITGDPEVYKVARFGRNSWSSGDAPVLTRRTRNGE
jgi:hypothetical protein